MPPASARVLRLWVVGRRVVQYLAVAGVEEGGGAKPAELQRMEERLSACNVKPLEGGLARYLQLQTPHHYGSSLLQQPQHRQQLCR